MISAGMRYIIAWLAKSASGWPSVDSSQSSTATTLGSVGWKIMLSQRKSPWTTLLSSPAGIAVGSHSTSASMSALRPARSSARYCFDQRPICRAK